MTQNLYRAAHESLIFFGPRPLSCLSVSGNDAASFLHHVLTQDIETMKTGEWREAALLSATSHVLGYFSVLCAKNSFLLISAPNQSNRLRALLEKFVIAEDVKIESIDSNWVLFEAWGPHAEKITHGSSQNAYLEPMRKDLPRRILFPAPIQADFSASGLLGDETLREILRIEKGLLEYQVDFDESIMLSETGLEKIAASSTKGCYPGQEVVAKIETYGRLNRNFVRLSWCSEEMPDAGAFIWDCKNENEIGRLTSRTYSPFLKKTIGLGWLKRGFFEVPGEVLIRAKNLIAAQSTPRVF